jgi:uncharacterized protein YjbJ (UPF0337 family)
VDFGISPELSKWFAELAATSAKFQGGSMNWDQVEGKWKQATGKIKEKWGKLTDDDLQMIAGKRDQLIGKIQERYGIAKEEAARQVDEFSRTYTDDTARGRGAGG